ncbi:MAG: transcriptional repressor [Bacteroidales bacterium]|nr:transcriptional repressor [Bacteroidales bacterium]
MANIKNKLSEKGLKITPQRLSILEAVYNLSHPTADDIIKYIRQKHSNIATGTVYKVLDTFIQKGLIKKVTTDKDVIRYDGLLIHHHHLHSSKDILIKDYIDEELDKILNDYFQKKKIKNFKIEEITLQIRGKFKK